ncbi:hypothetical protein LT493_24095 [Streptomyces tricolor]|nr:hypothetical protein [Streptomyces tricolor]
MRTVEALLAGLDHEAITACRVEGPTVSTTVAQCRLRRLRHGRPGGQLAARGAGQRARARRVPSGRGRPWRSSCTSSPASRPAHTG